MLEFSSPPLYRPPGPSHHTKAFGAPPSQEQDSIRYCLLLVTYAKHSGSAGGISGGRGVKCEAHKAVKIQNVFLFSDPSAHMCACCTLSVVSGQDGSPGM